MKEEKFCRHCGGKLDINTKAIKLKLKLLESTLFISSDIFTTGIIDVVLSKFKLGIIDA